MRLSVFSIAATTASVAVAAELRQVSDFGENPTNIEMYEYVPDTLADQPAIVVNVSQPDHLFHVSQMTRRTMSA